MTKWGQMTKAEATANKRPKDSYQSINDYKRNLGETWCGKGMREEVCYCLLLQENDIPDWIMPKEKIFLCGLRKHKGQCEHITWKRARELGTATNKYTPALGSYLLIGQSSLNSSARLCKGLSGTRQGAYLISTVRSDRRWYLGDVSASSFCYQVPLQVVIHRSHRTRKK